MSTISAPYWHPSEARGFILDWDGVIAETKLDFSGIRNKFFNGKRVPLIEASELLGPVEREDLWNDIYTLEMDGAKIAEPVKGAFELVQWLNDRAIPWAVVSRNCLDSIEAAAERIGFPLPRITMSRDEGPQKPDPEALLLAADRLGVDPFSCVMVGDFLYDIVGARRSGMRGVLVERIDEDWSFWADACYGTLQEMVKDLDQPKPLVPWEYHTLVARKGIKWLEKVWPLVIRLREDDPYISLRAFTALSIGVGCISVEPSAKVSMEQWENWPGALPRILDTSISSSLKDYLSYHYPLASVCDSEEGVVLDVDIEDLESRLEEIAL